MISSRVRRSASLVAVASLLSLALAAGSSGVALANAHGAGPSGERPTGQAKNGAGPTPLLPHTGPVLTSPRIQIIFWGSAWETGYTGAMDDLLGGMNGSAYMAVANQYGSAGTSATKLTDIVDTTAPPSKALSPSALGAEVAKKVKTPDSNTVYIVFTSNMPHISYCAYHSTSTADGVTVVVAYVPLQPAGCSPFNSSAGNIGANGYSASIAAAADSAAHEFMESITDPFLNAWYDKNGAEIADKCEYNYQGKVLLGNGTQWQIQSNWSNATNACDPGLGQ